MARRSGRALDEDKLLTITLLLNDGEPHARRRVVSCREVEQKAGS